MEKAVALYNCYTDIKIHLKVFYNPNIKTALGSFFPKKIQFGKTSFINKSIALHEISHTLGIGTNYKWPRLLAHEKYVGPKANGLIKILQKDPEATINADKSHFWPFGLNYASEGQSDQNLIKHCQLVSAMVEDLTDLTLGF